MAGRFRVLYTPLGGDPEQHFFDVSRLLLAVRDVVFAVDEVWHYQKPNWSPTPLKCMMLTGRHYGITLLWTAQRPAEVHRTLTSVSTELHVGRLTEEVDLRAIRSRIPAEALARIPGLKDRQFVITNERGGWTLEK